MAIDFPRDLAEKIAAQKISYGAALSLRFLGPEDRQAVAELLEALHPSCSLMREFSELIVDISKRDGASAREITGGFKNIMADKCSRKLKTEKIRRLLRERRWPSLTGKEKELKNALKKLALPENASLKWPENLEEKKASLSVTFRSASELRKSLDEIKNKAGLFDEFLELL
jgi:hypothetical protein